MLSPAANAGRPATRALVSIAVALALAVPIAVAAARPSVRRPPSAGQQRLLEQMAASFPRRAVISARIAKAPPQGRPSGYWLYFRNGASTEAAYARGIWQSEIIAGLYLFEAQTRGWVRPRWYENTLVLQGGKERVEGGTAVPLSGPLAATAKIAPATEKELLRLLRAAAAAAGVELRRVEFAQPLGRIAVDATVVTADGRRFLNDVEGRSKLSTAVRAADSTALAEGMLLEARDRQGRWVFSSGSATRLGTEVGVANPLFRK